MRGNGRKPGDNKLTPGSNMLWEGSRMMLPEHKRAILEQNQACQQSKRPELDEQKVEEIERALCHSLQRNVEIGFVLFEPLGDRILRGKIAWMDRLQIKVVTEAGDIQWIETADIVDVRG